MFMVVTKRLRIQGYIISDHYEHFPEFLRRGARSGCSDGRLRYRETVIDGIENAPRAFLGLLRGENIGKMLVKVGPDRLTSGGDRPPSVIRTLDLGVSESSGSRRTPARRRRARAHAEGARGALGVESITVRWERGVTTPSLRLRVSRRSPRRL